MTKLTSRRLQPAQIVALSFAVVITLGTILLSLPVSTKSGEGLRLVDAFFTATSATCVTGLAVVGTNATFSVFGQIVAPSHFAGKTLSQLDLRNTMRVQLIAIERNRRREDMEINVLPRAEDVLVLIGRNGDLDRITQISRE